MKQGNHCAKTSLIAAVSLGFASGLFAQSTYRVSKTLDSLSAPGANSLPGFTGGFRMQILIDESRLGALKGKLLTGFVVRRDLDRTTALKGGAADVVARLSTSTAKPERSVELFETNAPAKTQTKVFDARIAVPDSPPLGSSPKPWAANNSVTVSFSSSFQYRGGTLCLELEGRPASGNEPYFWYVDHESGTGGGKVASFGRNCSRFSASGKSLFAEAHGLQVGSTMRLTTIGRPKSQPLLLIGAAKIPGGADLTALGAIGCALHVVNYLEVPLNYAPKSRNFPFAFANLHLQIPASTSLLGSRVFAQSADVETWLPRSSWTNPAGLTSTNGLELQISTVGPTLRMAVVRSHRVRGTQPMPKAGHVDVEMAPVLRLLYR